MVCLELCLMFSSPKKAFVDYMKSGTKRHTHTTYTAEEDNLISNVKLILSPPKVKLRYKSANSRTTKKMYFWMNLSGFKYPEDDCLATDNPSVFI